MSHTCQHCHVDLPIFLRTWATTCLAQLLCLLLRWANEAAAALEELKKTTKALQEICGNVKCLVQPAALQANSLVYP